jgi:hypothetical protein
MMNAAAKKSVEKTVDLLGNLVDVAAWCREQEACAAECAKLGHHAAAEAYRHKAAYAMAYAVS